MNEVTYNKAKEIYEKEYANGKRSRAISVCDKLHKTYKSFCFNVMDQQDMSSRIRVLMVRDILEHSDIS